MGVKLSGHHSHIGGRIRLIRTAHKWSQKQLAYRMGDERLRGHISRVENGRFDPSIAYLRRIARALGCPMRELIPEDW